MTRHKPHCVLLVTGCIAPSHKVTMLALTDPEERRRQYLESIEYYIKKARVDAIVYCDNSGAPPELYLFNMANRYHKKFEWISFQGDYYKTIKKGKGAGEAEIVQYAIENSKMITHEDYLIKVTGRLCVKNINFLLWGRKDCSIYFFPKVVRDCRFYINTQIYMIPVREYVAHFEQTSELVDDEKGTYLEHAFGICIRENNVKYRKFRIVPWVEGVSGSTGRVYKFNLWTYFGECVRLWMYDERRTHI